MVNPRWWHDEHETSWSRVKQEVSADELAPDEEAYRYGAGARQHYGIAYREWDERIEAKLRDEWADLATGRSWDEAKGAVRRGWDRGTK